MKNSSNFAWASLDDIVFEGRNREYGAYLLRKLYVTNLWRGLIIAISLFLLLLSIPLISARFFPNPNLALPKLADEIPVILENIDLPDVETPIVETPQQPPAAPAAATPTKQFNDPVITNNPNAVTTVPDNQMPPGTQAGATTNAGTGGNTVGVPGGTGNQPKEPPAEEAPLLFAEVSPAFPGGTEALMAYLGSHITYPDMAKRNGLEGLVVLQFVVNEAGAISDITVVKKLGGGTDEEAMRVVKNMPRWSPGQQNGRAVKVRFTLPIKFSLGK